MCISVKSWWRCTEHLCHYGRRIQLQWQAMLVRVILTRASRKPLLSSTIHWRLNMVVYVFSHTVDCWTYANAFSNLSQVRSQTCGSVSGLRCNVRSIFNNSTINICLVFYHFLLLYLSNSNFTRKLPEFFRLVRQ